MCLANGKIERIAVDAVRKEANKPGSFLKPEIAESDKGISFDGNITVYSDDSEKKESFSGFVPVQVKGTQVRTFHSNNISFSLELKDYRNYLKTDGVILFVVEVMDNGETKIFYKSLLSMELSILISQYGKQSTKSVKLRPLEETTLYEVCRKFLNEKTYQSNYLIGRDYSIFDEFTGFKLNSMTFDPSNVKTSNIFDHDFVLYGVLGKIQFPLSFGRFDKISQRDVITFRANGELFDLNTQIIIEELITTIEIEEIFKIKINRKDNRFNYKFTKFHSLAAQLRALPLIMNLFLGKTVEFNGSTLSLDSNTEKLKVQYEKVTKHYAEINELKETFEFFGIPLDTEFEKGEDANLFGILRTLRKITLENKLIGINLEEPGSGRLINLNIANRRIVVFYEPKSDKILINAFANEALNIKCFIKNDINGEAIPYSIYILLNIDSLTSCNFNPRIVCESFDQFDPFIDEVTFTHSINFCLKCIKAFDKSGDRRLLDVAKYIIMKHNEKQGNNRDHNNIVLINLLQINYRLCSGLSDLETKALIKLKYEEIQKNDIGLLFCINVLLKNRTEAQAVYEQLDNKTQEFYKELPIYEIYHDLLQM
ncbi:DUF4365 domain-containing protein [Marinicrinis lubricantis]|uniref:DUF4365 domain-containing protein n=1 Tax=Marinicrinis lubricantis TaxID=2086470 RepID=A0ABW1IN26_9BACL